MKKWLMKGWPENLGKIESNISSTELWVLKEKIEAGIEYKMTEYQNVMNDEEFILHIQGEKYKICSYFEIEQIYILDEEGKQC